MTLSTPRWWYTRERAPGWRMRALLTPVSWIWVALTARRIARGEGVKVDVPVICVGNLTMGGSGKTPVAREIARRLGGHILSRGHGGRLTGPMRVDPVRHTAADVGDEPRMLARDLPVWIARDRPAGARAAVAGGAGVIVMDDGHQNPKLSKALSLVVVDGETRDAAWPFGDGRVFPAGPMREPLKAGLARADAVVMLLPADLDAPDPALLAVFGSTPVLIARLKPDAPPPTGRQVGFAGVAKPWKVEQALRASGCDLADFWPFPDHHPFDAAMIRRLFDRAEQFDAGLVTTEKDWVRLPVEAQAKVTPWKVRAVFDDEAALDALLARAVTE
jgi:tetraacyldisaccharide 4'-kinase